MHIKENVLNEYVNKAKVISHHLRAFHQPLTVSVYQSYQESPKLHRLHHNNINKTNTL